jgi:seryl-tRNA synthetase
MSKSRAELEKKLDELTEELKKVNKSFPSIERRDSWIIKDIDEERLVVLASKKDKGKIVFQTFEPVGVWKEVYDLLVLRKKILHEIGKIDVKLHGPVVFTSRELAGNGFITDEE